MGKMVKMKGGSTEEAIVIGIFILIVIGGVSWLIWWIINKCKKLENLFSGPTAVAFSNDAITSAKILTKFAKSNSNLKIIGGIMEEEPLTAEDVEKIAMLPTLDEARAKIVGILTAPAQKIISILLAPGSKIAILTLEKSKQST